MSRIITEEVYLKIKAIASEKPSYANDDFSIDDYSGDNVDDAYQIGYDDGKIDMADEILRLLEEQPE